MVITQVQLREVSDMQLEGAHTFYYDEAVPLSQVRVHRIDDGGYQRHLSASKVKGWAKKFRPASVGVVLLSLRADGLYYILDGQHRAELLRMVGKTTAAAKVFTGLTLAEESEIYLDNNSERVHSGGCENHFARLRAEQPNALSVQAVVDRMGYIIPKTAGGVVFGRISAIADLYQAQKILGEEGLVQAFQFLESVFGRVPQVTQGDWFLGLAYWISRYRDETIDMASFRRKLANAGLLDVSAKAIAAKQMYGTGNNASNIARAFTAVYNWHKHANLLSDYDDPKYRSLNRQTKRMRGKHLDDAA